MNPLKPITHGKNGQFTLPEDGFVQIFPFGEWNAELDFGAKAPAGVNGIIQDDRTGHHILPIVQVLDRAAAEAISAAFPGEILLDYDHDAHRGGHTRAAGWIDALEVRNDGLWGKVRWSAAGLEDVQGGNYRFLSPVFPFPALEDLGDGRRRPRNISGAALTNRPRLVGIQAVSNAQPSAADAAAQNSPEQPGAETAAASAAEQERKRIMLEKLIAALGLPPDSTEDAVLAAVSGLVDRVKAIEAQQKEVAAENDLKTFAGVIVNRDAVKAALIKDREGTLAVLNALAKPADPANPAKAMNNGKDPSKTAGDATNTKSAQRIAFVAEVQKTYALNSRAQAWSKAATLKPELFND